MGVRRLLSGLLVFLNRLAAVFAHRKALHTARFAGLHEITSLLSSRLDEASLLLGMSRFSQVLRVRSTAARASLGNLRAWLSENKRSALRYERLGVIIQSLLRASCIFLVAGHLARQL